MGEIIINIAQNKSNLWAILLIFTCHIYKRTFQLNADINITFTLLFPQISLFIFVISIILVNFEASGYERLTSQLSIHFFTESTNYRGKVKLARPLIGWCKLFWMLFGLRKVACIVLSDQDRSILWGTSLYPLTPPRYGMTKTHFCTIISTFLNYSR